MCEGARRAGGRLSARPGRRGFPGSHQHHPSPSPFSCPKPSAAFCPLLHVPLTAARRPAHTHGHRPHTLPALVPLPQTHRAPQPRQSRLRPRQDHRPPRPHLTPARCARPRRPAGVLTRAHLCPRIPCTPHGCVLVSPTVITGLCPWTNTGGRDSGAWRGGRVYTWRR